MKYKKGTKLGEWRKNAQSTDLKCEKCGKEGYMTLDHIIPVSFIHALGLVNESYDDEWNFQYLCRACNVLKQNSIDFRNPKSFENIERYVEKAKEYYK